MCLRLWKLGICQGSTSPENLFLFDISQFFSLFLSSFPSLLYTNLQVSIDPPWGAREGKRDHTWNWKKDLHFPEGKRTFSVEKRVCRKSKVAPKSPKPPIKAEHWTTQMAEGRRRVEVGSGTRAGITLQSRLFQSVDLDYSRGSRAWADLCSVWAVRKLLRRWMPWWSQFWPWCFWGAGRRGPRTQSWGQWDHL